jgi:hypothetical protein
MSRRALLLRLVAAGAMLALAASLVLLARDVWHWQRALADADARATLQPIGANAWAADTALPGGFVRRLLGIDDDLTFRRAAMQALALSRSSPSALSGNERILVEAALARIVLTDGNRARASRAADYLGVLLYEDKSTPQQAISPYVNPNAQPAQTGSEQTPEEKAASEFATAVRLDPSNANAKHNLEVMLQQAGPPSQQGSTNPGSGERLGHKGSGSRPPGYGY